MNHLVYLDKKAREYEKIANGTKSMIVRGATGRKMPYGRVHENNILYFIHNDGSSKIIGKAKVSGVFDSNKMTKEESHELIDSNMPSLDLTDQQYKRWAGKRYIVLVSFSNFKELEPIKIDRSSFSNMDDWIPLESINEITKD